MSNVGELIKERVNKILPKVLSEAEKTLGYSLPNVKLVEVDTFSTGRINQYGDYEIIINGVTVDAIISKKDGTFGKVKKLVEKTIENVLNVSGYDVSDIYVAYKRGENQDFITERLIRTLKNNLKK